MQLKPIAEAVLAPELIVCDAFEVIAIDAVLAATVHTKPSVPPSDPGVSTFTV